MTDVNVFNWWVELQLMSLIIVTYDVIFPLILLITELQLTITNEFRLYSQSQYNKHAQSNVYCCDIVNIINMLES